MKRSGYRRLLILILWFSAPVLLWIALKDTPLSGIVETIQKMQLWEVLVLVLLNATIILLITARWHLILKTIKQPVPFFALTGYRLAGFALSYFTPGTQFGGEPLQVLLLQQRHKVPVPAAVSSVYLDKLLEVLSNFTFLVIGLLALFQRGFLSQLPNAWLGWLIPVVLLFPATHLIALWSGRRPLGALIRKMCQIFPRVRLFCRIHDSVYQAEGEIMIYSRQKPLVLLQTVTISAIVWGLMIFEFGLVYRFLGISFSLTEIIIAMVLARFSFLVPVPAGLGALEGSQVLAMGLLGVNPAAGVAVCLWIRLRDITFGLIGIWVGSMYAGKTIRNDGKSVDINS
jgi:glycosyltransferase 2 family protein